MIDTRRIFRLNEIPVKKGPVIYWMSRDQRASDNWGLLYARELASDLKKGLAVVFCLVKDFPGAQKSHFDYMLSGLFKAAEDLEKKNIAFHIMEGKPEKIIAELCEKNKAGALITDFDPLRIKRKWKSDIIRNISTAFFEADAHNIVPCRLASEKQEYGAYTIRPKIKRLLPEFLGKIPPLHKMGGKIKLTLPASVSSPEPGISKIPKPENALRDFIKKRLCGYDENRNDPNLNGQSGLSPYLHFGTLSAQRTALEIEKSDAPQKDKEAFLEELIIRRELSDNFCFYNKNYDNVKCFPDWASKTLNEHLKDEREYLYSHSELESAATHDKLWNAAQIQMIKEGKMHGYMRMYWAKKILEWSSSPEEALEKTINLNDKYELDGRDPNGFAGAAWSIGGVHDRAWTERPVFGKIRYMNYNGCRRKFDTEKYIRKYPG
ncbi:MAG: deoxyribodipyrimidine photo-lyase [Fibrobacterota bacterium]